MQEERKIKVPTTGTYDFPSLILGGKGKYIDKTDLLYSLVNDADTQLFMSRPRRFGKSLMLSTLKAMFEGRRELFKGLAIDSLPWEGWEQPTPVYSFTMSSATGETYEGFMDRLGILVEGLCKEAGVPYQDKGPVSGRFEDFLKAVAEKSPTKKIVVLIDEYDEPVAKFLDDLPTLNKVRSVLHDFYEKLKVNSGSIRFLMMTGVTKLTKLSIFSGLNHLTDVTMNPRFATLLGYTPEELDGSLRENIEVFAAKNGMDFAAAKKALLAWYDGYRFSPESEAKVCNPVSLGNALKTCILANYWEATGQATTIVNRIKAAKEIPADLNGLAATRTQLDVCAAETMPLPALLYQGGYLTIKEAIDANFFRLGIPNNEIANSLAEGYVSTLLDAGMADWTEQLVVSREGLIAKGVESLLTKNLKAAFAAVPHEWKIEDEKEAKRYFLLFMKLIGADISGERQSARGRADAVLQDQSGTYVFEFKYGKTPQEALEQARTKEYGNPWLDRDLPVFHVGVNYDPKKRGIDDPLVEPAGGGKAAGFA
ncbi:MAG: AAA family ATPase [Kiritimatiellae bacterium]|nr:AAA family ATPase [Kiritimatiellia bacterium]